MLRGQNHSEESKQKISEARGTVVEILDLENNVTKIFSSGRRAAKELNVDPKTIVNYIKSQKLFKGRYKITSWNK